MPFFLRYDTEASSFQFHACVLALVEFLHKSSPAQKNADPQWVGACIPPAVC
jgi:hypothetical protein